MTAAYRGSGTGIGNTRTLSLGLISTSTPPRAKTAPEAPITIEKVGPRSKYKMFPNIPPMKNTVKTFFSPSNAHKYLPKK